MKRKFLAIVAVLMVLLAGCSSEDDGKIHMPFGANDYDGVNYQEIVSQLEEAGFTNVREEPLGDLVTGWLNDEGEVMKSLLMEIRCSAPILNIYQMLK